MTKEEYRSNNQWNGSSIQLILKNKKENLNSLVSCILPFFLIKPDLFSDVKDNSFSRSRSSSVTSIDKESREAISALHFCETFTRKADTSPSPCLWVGTTLGTVLVIVLNLPPGGEQRLLQPVIVSPSGMYKSDRLKYTLMKCFCCS